MPRREGTPQFARDFRKSKPVWNLTAVIQASPQLCAREIEHTRTSRHFVFREIFVPVFHVNHHLERNHFDADLLLMGAEQFLRFIRSVEWLTIGIVAWPRVIATDNEVRAAVIFSNDGVPDRFPRS